MATPGKREEWTLKLGRPLGTPLAKGIAKLPIKIHPNVVTVFSLILILIAAFNFFKGWLLLGAIFYYVGYVFDTADGTLARLTNTQSRLGERLDFYCDILGNIFMYFGLWYSQYYLAGNWFTGAGIIVAHYSIVVALGIFIQQPHYKTIFPRVRSYYSPEEEGFGTFFMAPIFNVVTILFPLLVLFQFISFVILLVRQKERPDVRRGIKGLLKT